MALGTLGVLQYRWLRDVADAQKSRMRSDAAARAAAIGQDFDREITRAFLMLPLDAASVASRDAAAYAARYEEFRRSAPWPDMVRGVFARDAAGALLRFSESERRLLPVAWPSELEPIRERLEKQAGPGPTLSPGIPALLVPVAEPILGIRATPGEIRNLPPAALHHLVIRHAQGQPPGPCTILLLDRDVLTRRLLPEIVIRRLAGAGDEYEASVVDAASGALLYGGAAGDGDARAELFRLRLEELDNAILKTFVPDVLRAAGGERVSLRVVESVTSAGGARPGRWRLSLRRKQGAVEQAVRAVLLRNLAIAFSVLAVLGASA